MRPFKTALVLAICLTFGNADRLDFPSDYKDGVKYATVERGSVIEDIYASQSALEAVKSGKNIPQNTVIAMEEYQNENGKKGKLNRYIIMKKIDNDWQYEAFLSDKSLNARENPKRCYDCHDDVPGADKVWTLDKMKNFKGK